MQNTEIWQWRRREKRPLLIKVSERQAAIFLSKNHFSKGGIYFRKEEFSRYFNEVQRPTTAIKEQSTVIKQQLLIDVQKPDIEPIKPMLEPIKEQATVIKEQLPIHEAEVTDTSFNMEYQPEAVEKPKRRRRKNND